MRRFVASAIDRLSARHLPSRVNLAFCLAFALIAGCSSIPVAPTLGPLPPDLANLRLLVNSVDTENDANKVTEGGSIDAELLPALALAFKTAGFHLVFDPATADSIVGLTATSGPTNSSLYHTTLTLRTREGTQIDQVRFVGGAIGVPWSGAPEYVAPIYKQIARGIAFNLVDRLIKSPVFLAFAHQAGANRQAAVAGPSSSVGKAEMRQTVIDTMREAAGGAPGPGQAGSIDSDVDRPGYKLREDPHAFAIVVGVEQYSHDLPAAQFAARDAQAMKNHLVALGYPERNIKLLLGSRAVRSALEAYLEEWLPRNVKEGDRVFFYFSGHGAPDPASGQAYLVPWDGVPNFLDRTAYPLKKLYAGLNSLKAGQVVVVLDACFSGAGGRSVLAQGTRPLVVQADISAILNPKLVLFAASLGNEVTATLADQGHGIFTYYFLKGLGGEARSSAGVVTMRGLYQYLKPKVQDAASLQNRDQTPVLEGPAEGELARF